MIIFTYETDSHFNLNAFFTSVKLLFENKNDEKCLKKLLCFFVPAFENVEEPCIRAWFCFFFFLLHKKSAATNNHP